MITVASQMFNKDEKELHNSNQLNKNYEEYIGDKKVKNDIIDKVCGDNIEDIRTEKNKDYKNNSINTFLKFQITTNVNCNQTNNYCVIKFQKYFINPFLCKV